MYLILLLILIALKFQLKPELMLIGLDNMENLKPFMEYFNHLMLLGKVWTGWEVY